jgi:hypothetical protein
MQRSAEEAVPVETPRDNQSGWLSALNRWTPTIITIGLALGVGRSLLEPLHSGLPWMTYEEDDFFYYLKIAQNLAHGAGSTFNGVVPTNGYHPLWMMVVTVFSFFTSKPRAILIFLSACSFISTVATYFLSRTLIRLSGGGRIIANALAAYVALYSLHIFTGGMEVILTVPLAFAVLVVAQKTAWWQRGLWQSACLGLLVSAMVLSRLDSILMATLIFVALLLNPVTRRSLRREHWVGLVIGLLPLAIYFLSNQVFFHTWLPVSGMAKQLKFNHLPSNPAFHSLYGKQKSQLLSVVPVVIAIGLLPFLYKRLTPMQQVLYPVALVFPFLYLSILSCLSDWQLWGWYFYTFRVALCIAFALFCLWTPTASILRQPIVGYVAALVMLALIFRTHSATGAQYQLLEIAEDVRGFASTHPGVYAMGDRSGMVAYLLPEPIIQTEGLVMDKAFLVNIQQQVPLRTALAKYGVRYYIATTYPPYATGCVHIAEPYQAGPASAHMSADFCQQPAAVFQQRDLRTSIYDLGGTPAAP